MGSTMEMRMKQAENRRNCERKFSENEIRSILRQELRMVLKEELSEPNKKNTIIIKNNNSIKTGDDNGRKNALLDYNHIMKYYNFYNYENNNIVLDFHNFKVVSLSYIEGYIEEFLKFQYGEVILRNIEIEANDFIKNRFYSILKKQNVN